MQILTTHLKILRKDMTDYTNIHKIIKHIQKYDGII